MRGLPSAASGRPAPPVARASSPPHLAVTSARDRLDTGVGDYPLPVAEHSRSIADSRRPPRHDERCRGSRHRSRHAAGRRRRSADWCELELRRSAASRIRNRAPIPSGARFDDLLLLAESSTAGWSTSSRNPTEQSLPRCRRTPPSDEATCRCGWEDVLADAESGRPSSVGIPQATTLLQAGAVAEPGPGSRTGERCRFRASANRENGDEQSTCHAPCPAHKRVSIRPCSTETETPGAPSFARRTFQIASVLLGRRRSSVRPALYSDYRVLTSCSFPHIAGSVTSLLLTT